jgi:hypothetical protein
MPNSFWKVENPTTHSIADFLMLKISYDKFHHAQEQFLEDLCLYIIKWYNPLRSIENI